MRTTIVAAVTTLLLLIALSPGASAAPKKCGDKYNFTVRGFTYSVRVIEGSITCPKARDGLRTFIRTFAASSRYFCVRGHGNDTYTASCATKTGKTRFRAYLVAG